MISNIVVEGNTSNIEMLTSKFGCKVIVTSWILPIPVYKLPSMPSNNNDIAEMFHGLPCH